MRITYVARSTLDYRVTVLAELDKLSDGQLCFVASKKWVPDRVRKKLSATLGVRAIFLDGEKSIGVDEPQSANTSFCLPFQPGLLDTIRSTDPDVLLGDGFFQWTFAAIVHRLRHGTPLVICYERWKHTERQAQWYRRLYRKIALRFTDAVCCNGTLCAEYTGSLGFPPSRITTGHMAADVEKLQQQVESIASKAIQDIRDSWQTQRTVFLYVGQLIQRKGLSHLLDGWRSLERQHPDNATLLVVGAGPEENHLKNQAASSGLRQVRFCGPVDYDHLAAFYAASDVFIIPTLEDNWSLVVPEAMACGLPVLCSKYNGCWPELVINGRNGWVFDPLSPPDLLRCLEACLQCPGYLPVMGNESREILKAHTPQKSAEALMRTARLAIGNRQGCQLPIW